MDPQQQPRLSILHLLVGTACIALYLGITRPMWIGPSADVGGGEAAMWCVWGVGSGAALGGFVLLVARRCKGWVYPQHPGEVAFAIFGLESAFELLSYAIGPLLGSVVGYQSIFFYGGREIIQALVTAGLFVLAAYRSPRGRWRFYFQITAAAYFCYFLAACSLPLFFAAVLVADAILFIAVLLDLRDGRRYPWTHWMGVWVDLWSIPMIATTLVAFVQSYWSFN